MNIFAFLLTTQSLVVIKETIIQRLLLFKGCYQGIAQKSTIYVKLCDRNST